MVTRLFQPNKKQKLFAAGEQKQLQQPAAQNQKQQAINLQVNQKPQFTPAAPGNFKFNQAGTPSTGNLPGNFKFQTTRAPQTQNQAPNQPRAFGAPGLRPGQLPGGARGVPSAPAATQSQATSTGSGSIPGNPFNNPSPTQPNFDFVTDKKGRVKVNPFTGKKIKNKKNRFTPEEAAAKLNPAGLPDGFEFTDIPDSGVQTGFNPNSPTGSAGDLSNQGQSFVAEGREVLEQGQGLVDSGGQLIDRGVDFLFDQAPGIEETRDSIRDFRGGVVDREQAQLAEIDDLQAKALNPEFDPETRRGFQEAADRRRANINARFDVGGTQGDLFAKQQADEIANLVNSNILDSSTGAQAIGNLASSLVKARNEQLFAADEQSRAEELAERERIGQAATDFGGISGNLAQTSAALGGQLFADELGAGQLLSSIGTDAAGIGAGEQAVGAELQNIANQLFGTGAGAQESALRLGLDEQGQQADLQLAQTGQDAALKQAIFDNFNFQRNNNFNRRTIKDQLELLRELNSQSSSGGGFLGGIFGF